MSDTKFIFFRQEPYHNTFFGVYDANQIQYIRRMFIPKAEALREKEIKWAKNNLLANRWRVETDNSVTDTIESEEYLKTERNTNEYISRWENKSTEELIDTYMKDNNYFIMEIPYNNVDELYFNNPN